MSNLKEAICSLMQVARVLKKRRFEGGALELEGVEVKLTLQRTGDGITVEEILPKQVCSLFVQRGCGVERAWCPSLVAACSLWRSMKQLLSA